MGPGTPWEEMEKQTPAGKGERSVRSGNTEGGIAWEEGSGRGRRHRTGPGRTGSRWPSRPSNHCPVGVVGAAPSASRAALRPLVPRGL